MKKIVYVLLILTFLFAFAACAKTGSEAETTTSDTTQTASTTSAPEVETEPSSEHKAVVIYFSRAGEQYGVGTIEKGNTKIVAEMIADKTGADLFEIEPTDNRYDLSYDDLTDYAKKEQADNARPEYKGSIDLSPYDVVYLGYPIWWGDLPMIVYSFLENNDFSGKTVYAFCTHAGSGDAGTARNIAKTIPDSAINENVLAITGTTAQNDQVKAGSDVENWLKEIEQ